MWQEGYSGSMTPCAYNKQVFPLSAALGWLTLRSMRGLKGNNSDSRSYHADTVLNTAHTDRYKYQPSAFISCLTPRASESWSVSRVPTILIPWKGQTPYFIASGCSVALPLYRKALQFMDSLLSATNQVVLFLDPGKLYTVNHIHAWCNSK